MMKRMIRRFSRAMLSPSVSYLAKESLVRNRPSSKASQLLLTHQYRLMAASREVSLPTFSEVGFREYSEFEEDGILLFLFSLLRTRTKTCLEICAGTGMECNTAN